jgi:hypothetical protein
MVFTEVFITDDLKFLIFDFKKNTALKLTYVVLAGHGTIAFEHLAHDTQSVVREQVVNVWRWVLIVVQAGNDASGGFDIKRQGRDVEQQVLNCLGLDAVNDGSL